ncbi:MAG: hypothetical protein HKN53_05975 [Maribacter sp.]|nr:hypothetical protein [Maribacter sp.]
MKLFRNRSFILSLVVLMVAVFFVPSVVKITHALSEHEHLECKAFGELHIHGIELDCDFEDFNLSPQNHSYLVEIPKPLIIEIPKRITFQYTFLSKYQKLHFALRGPPSAS